MHTEEGEARIRNRIDEVFEQVPAVFGQVEVVAAKRNDTHRGACAGESCDPVALQTAAVDERFGLDAAFGRLEMDPGRGHLDVGDLPPVADVAPELRHVVGVRASDGDVVDDAGLRNVKSSQSASVRLEVGDLLPRQTSESIEPVGAAAALELVEPRDLVLAGGDDELAALLERNVFLLAVAHEA